MSRQKIEISTLNYPDNILDVVERLEKLDFFKEIYLDYDKNSIIVDSEVNLSKYQKDLIIYSLSYNEEEDKQEFNHLRNIVKREHTHFGDDEDEEDHDHDHDEEDEDEHEHHHHHDEEDEHEHHHHDEDDEHEHHHHDEVVTVVSKRIVVKYQDKLNEYLIKSNIVKEKHHEHHHHDDECECGHHHHDGDACGCGHHHGIEDDEEEETNKVTLILNIIGLVIFVVMTILHFATDLKYLLIGFIVSYGLIAYDIIWNSIKGIIHGQVFNENFLMVIASLGALCINEPIEGIMVITLYKVGEFLQDKATDRSKKSIKSLMELKQDTVTLSNGEVKDIEDVNVGDVISVRVGERIPLDGIIKSGSTDVDMKALTGESAPVYLNEGSEILSGSINLSKVIEVEVTKKDHDSTISKVMNLVEEATKQKSDREAFITKFAKVYTPIVLVIALLTGLIEGFVFKVPVKDVLNNVFSILVISCPCALVISIPLAYFAGIGRSSSLGILVRGGTYLDVLNKNGYYIFDKTGTITKGNFKVSDVYPEDGYTKEQVLELIALVEQFSNHPIAQSIQDAVGDFNYDIDVEVEEIGGQGLKVIRDNQVILVGNKELMNSNNIKYNIPSNIGTILYLAIDGVFYGSVVIVDEIKEESKELIEYLNANNETVMLTGDTGDVAKYVGEQVKIKHVEAELLPKQKFAYIKDLLNNGKTVIYVGDGINDSPSLKLASVGIAMGAAGSDSAKECADIIIVDDDISKVKDAINVAKFTNKIVIENITFALLVKVVALVLGIWGILGNYAMLLAIFADVGVCLLVVLNTMRILKHKVRKNKK